MAECTETCVLDGSLRMRLHPEALFDAPYEDAALNTGNYRRSATPLALESTPDGSALITDPTGATMQVEFLAQGGIIRVRCHPGALPPRTTTEQLGLVTVPETVPADWGAADGVIRGSCGNLVFTCSTTTGDWQVARRDGAVLCATRGGGIRWGCEPADLGGTRFLAAFDLPQGPVYGFGGRIANFNRRGSTADMYAVKGGARPGDYGGFPIPCFLSPEGFAVFVNNPWPHVYFDMGATADDQWWVHAPGGDCDFFIIDGPALSQVLERFTRLVGRIPFPKRWWFGFWTSALAFATADEVTGVGRRLRRGGYPCDVLVIDGPWRGGPEFLDKYMSDGEYPTNNLNWHPDFGDGPGMLARNAELGFKTVIHQNSRSWLPKTIAEHGGADGALRVEGRECVVRVGTEKGERFYADAVRPRHLEGIGTWWLDHGDRVSGELLPGIPSRNLFGALWSRLTADRLEADGAGRQLTLIRGAGIGGQRSALPWPGDTRFGVDAFIEDVWFCLSAGLCGFPVTSFDLGGFMPCLDEDPGYNTAYDMDNLARRLCQGILVAPSPRMHQSNTDPAKLPWNCPAAIQRLYRAMLIERYRLTPYVFSYAIEAARTGSPILRPLVYGYQHDETARTIGDQCLLGDWLLAAPVFRHGDRTRRLYLPAGTWICWWTGTRFDGPAWIEVEAPLLDPEGLPLFVRAGAIVPRMDPAACLSDAYPDPMTLDVFPCGDSEFVCHECRTVSHHYRCSAANGHVELRVPNGTGRERHHVLRVRLACRPKAIRVDGVSVDPRAWSWDPESRVATCHLDVPDGATAQVTFGA